MPKRRMPQADGYIQLLQFRGLLDRLGDRRNGDDIRMGPVACPPRSRSPRRSSGRARFSFDVEYRCPEVRPIDGELIADEVEQLTARARERPAATRQSSRRGGERNQVTVPAPAAAVLRRRADAAQKHPQRRRSVASSSAENRIPASIPFVTHRFEDARNSTGSRRKWILVSGRTVRTAPIDRAAEDERAAARGGDTSDST